MTREAPTVSAIIPCYNRERYIRRTVESVLAQTYDNIELVVVDDGCTDGSRAVLESFGSRLRILEHAGRENRGQSAGINLGLAATSGKYVGILDSDDIWLPDKIAEQVAFLETHAEFGLVYGNGEAVDENERPLYDIYPAEHEELNEPGRVLLDCYFLVPNNSLVRRDVLNRTGGFDETLRAAQDHDMAVRIAEVAKLAYVDRKWFQYRRHGASISRNGADLRWRNGFRILDKASRRYAYPGRVLRARRGVLHFRLAQCHIERSEYARAAGRLACAFLNDPRRAVGVLLRRERRGSPH